ncbi:MAG: arylsulfatase [Verrucomicrobia bacterium]|nr:arylsulfatase [Verrucomicrobiota bacterium]
MKYFPRSLLVAAALCLPALSPFLPTTTFAAAPAPRPNIIVILSDDMGWSDLGCFGGEIHTPNLDALAEGGLRFTQFYNTARCCPTRAALLTGLYSHQAGIGHMTDAFSTKVGEAYAGDLSKRAVTLAQALKPAGYRAYAVGKWHVAKDMSADGPKHNWPLQRGFDRYYGTITGAGSFYDPGTLTRDNTAISPFADAEYRPAKFYYTDAITEHAVRFVNDHQRDHAREPFLLYCAYTAAHWPMHAKPEDIAKYKGKYDAGYDAIRNARIARLKQLGLVDPRWQPAATVGDWTSVTNKEWEARCMETYAAMIDCMDQGIGRLVAALKANGQFENTLLFFLQDNGACAETVGRGPKAGENNEKTYPVIARDATRTDVIPKQLRDGRAVRQGPGVMPGDEDTYIAYGEAWANVSNTPFRLYKHWEHEGGISTPLIAHWPAGIKVGRAVLSAPGGGVRTRRPTDTGALADEPGHLIDIMATCVDVAGAKYPAEFGGEKIIPMQGVSLRPAFEGEPLNRPQPIFWEHEGNRAVRDGQWKLVSKHPGGWELYDMAADRTEQHDLSSTDPGRVSAMSAQWDAWAKKVGVQPWPLKGAGEKKAAGKNKKAKQE